MHAEGLSDAGSEAVGLYQCTNKRTNVVNPGSVHQIAESFRTGFTCTHFQIYQVELVAEVGMGVVQVLAYPHQCLIEGQAGFHADHGEVQRIGQSDADALLTVLDHAFQKKSRNEESKSRNAGQHEEIVEAEKKYYSCKSEEPKKQARPEVVVDVTGVAQSGLNQPPPRARNIGGRERDRFAERVQCLLEAFPERGF